MFSYSFLNLTQFELNISAPNHQNIVKGGSAGYFDTPGIPWGRIHSEDIMVFVIVFDISEWWHPLDFFFQITPNKVWSYLCWFQA